VELAVVLATQPKLLLLDEPLAGAGAEETQRLVALLRSLRGGFGLLLVEHDMQAVFALADRISVLVSGRIVITGSPDEIRDHPEVRTAYLAGPRPACMMLKVENLAAGYGESQVLFDVSLEVGVGEVLALLGRNGMGKTTTIAAMIGLLPPWGGVLEFEGQPIAGLRSFRIARRGVGLVPEGRQIFPTLTVEENLVATAARRGSTDPRWTLQCVWELFPRLKERRRDLGSRLSGGEQQMLAIGRALMTNPRLLILDEAIEGLAPVIRAEIWAVLAALKSEGQTILVIDKNLSAVLRLADRIVVLEKGRSVWTGSSAALASAPGIRDKYLHL
jgi:branched-chain amino acid transport system ATP-binding protein